MLYYDRIDIAKSEGINVTKSNSSKECMVCHYYILNQGFKFQDYVCNGFYEWLCCVLFLVVLLLSLLKMLIIVVLFMKFANQNQFSY